MDALARPKDDLFDNSVMTFGEHLEELRHCLIRAIICLAAGAAIGLFFADDIVRYVQDPLRDAIVSNRADRSVERLGLPKDDPRMDAVRNLLAERGLEAEVVYDLGGDGSVVIDPSDPEALAEAVATGATFEPRVQLRKTARGVSSLKIEEPFGVWIKAGLIAGAVIASPGIFYYLWSFVAAGLHAHERKYVYVYLPFSVALFVAGVSLAFWVALQYVIGFLLDFNDSLDVSVDLRLSYYVNFVLLLPLGFGVAFQLPLVMLFLQRIGLFETDQYVASWKVAVLVIFVVAMIVTPADVASMFLLAVPLLALYALGIALCQFMPRGRGLGSDAYDPA